MFDDLNKARRVALEDYTRLYNDVHGGRYTEDDKAQRDALEKAQHGATNAPRRDLVGILNGETQVETNLDGIAKLRDKYQYRSPEKHNLRRASNFDNTNFRVGDDVTPRSGRDRDDARDDRIGPDLKEARRLLDAAGKLIGGNRDLWPSGQAERIEAEFLLEAARAIILAVNARAKPFAARRDI